MASTFILHVGKRRKDLVSLSACLHSLQPQDCGDERFLQHSSVCLSLSEQQSHTSFYSPYFCLNGARAAAANANNSSNLYFLNFGHIFVYTEEEYLGAEATQKPDCALAVEHTHCLRSSPPTATHAAGAITDHI